jgi:hypothetical protein
MQVKEILSEGTITFPLKECDYLRKVKVGELDYLSDVAPKLEGLMDELEVLASNSTLPESVDREFWDDFIVEVLENEVLR